MKKRKHTQKKQKGFFVCITIIAIIGLISLSIILVCVSNCKWMTANLASILSGVLSAIATTILGAVAVWQNIEYRKLSDELDKRTFKAQVLSSCPYFSVINFIIETDDLGNHIFKMKLNNIGNSLATFVLPSDFEFSKFGYYYGKNSNEIIHSYYTNDYTNIEPNSCFEFVTEPLKLCFEDTSDRSYFTHIILSIVGQNQIQFDQEIQLEYKIIDGKLTYVAQHQMQFLNIYEN